MLKEQKIQEMETRQRNIQEAEKRNQELIQKEQERCQKVIADKQKAEVRGQQAINKELENIQKVKNHENELRNIEKKQKVKELESRLSHYMAEEFRLKENKRKELELIEKRNEEANNVYSIDKYGNKIDNCINSSSSIDYTNTCFHNTLIVKHDTDLTQVAGSKSIMSKSAFESADHMNNDIERIKYDKIEQKIRNDKLAHERGKAALEKLNTKQFELECKPKYEPNNKELQKSIKQKKANNLLQNFEKMFSTDSDAKAKATSKTNASVISDKKKKTEQLIQKNTVKVDNNSESEHVKKKQQIIMPDVVIEEDVNGEKSDCESLNSDDKKVNLDLQNKSNDSDYCHQQQQILQHMNLHLQQQNTNNPSMNVIYQQLQGKQQLDQNQSQLLQNIQILGNQIQSLQSQSQAQTYQTHQMENTEASLTNPAHLQVQPQPVPAHLKPEVQMQTPQHLQPGLRSESTTAVEPQLQMFQQPRGLDQFIRNNEELRIKEESEAETSQMSQQPGINNQEYFSEGSQTSSDSDGEAPPIFENRKIIPQQLEDQNHHQQVVGVAQPSTHPKQNLDQYFESASCDQRAVVFSQKQENPNIEKYSHLLPENQNESLSQTSSQFSNEFL